MKRGPRDSTRLMIAHVWPDQASFHLIRVAWTARLLGFLSVPNCAMEVLVHARWHGLIVLISDVFAYHLRIQEAITVNAAMPLVAGEHVRTPLGAFWVVFGIGHFLSRVVCDAAAHARRAEITPPHHRAARCSRRLIRSPRRRRRGASAFSFNHRP